MIGKIVVKIVLFFLNLVYQSELTNNLWEVAIKIYRLIIQLMKMMTIKNLCLNKEIKIKILNHF